MLEGLQNGRDFNFPIIARAPFKNGLQGLLEFGQIVKFRKRMEIPSDHFARKQVPLFASPRLGSNTMTMEVALNRADRVYRPGVRGVIAARRLGWNIS